MIWHGYEQHPDAHGERPWWRGQFHLAGRWWWRRDGWDVMVHKDAAGWAVFRRDDDGRATEPPLAASSTTHNGALEAFDRENPLPPPPPQCGQVWVHEEPDAPAGPRTVHMTISGVDMQAGVVRAVRFSWVGGDYCGRFRPSWSEDGETVTGWPPGAVLVYGPGSPWAPMGGEE